MIDLSPMKSVRVDPVKRTARAEAGLTWGEYNRETQAFGLASTGGVVSTTGIAGLTLGGGLGWLHGKHGLSCDNLLSADIVTADGQFLTASADQNPDLFWGLRGGGGNFGVVTSFEYQLHPVGPVLAGMVIHPMAKAKEVLRFYRDFCRSCPDEMVAAARTDDVARRRPGRCHRRRLYRRSGCRREGGGAAPQIWDAAGGYDRPDLLRAAEHAVRRGLSLWRGPAVLEIELSEGARGRHAGDHDRAVGEDALADVDRSCFSMSTAPRPGSIGTRPPSGCATTSGITT